jgi:hypothetical protein
MGRNSEFQVATGREPDAYPVYKLKAELHGHLINDHEYLRDGIGSTYPPSKAEMQRIHDMLHEHDTRPQSDHIHG